MRTTAHPSPWAQRPRRAGANDGRGLGPPARDRPDLKGYTLGMKTPACRALSTLLAAALILGAVPPSAQAQFVRVAAGRTGWMPVSPVGSSASGATAAPALGVGAASLTGVFYAPSSPSAAPALAVSVRAAASSPDDAPKLPNAPEAAVPAESAGSAEGSAPSSEAAKDGADRTFDGAVGRTAADGSAVAGETSAPAPAGLKAAISSVSSSKRAAAVDAFGGPSAEPMSFKQRVGYGLNRGLRLVGVGAILEIALRPLLGVFPWPQYLSDQALRGLGRASLLTSYGPGEIAERLADSPAAFLGLQLPMAVAAEEIIYRLLGFGLTFLALAALKPFALRASSMVDVLPDAAGAAGGVKLALKIGDQLSRRAFPIAAALSAAGFAAAHLGAWGFSPFVLAFYAVLGLFLAKTAYVSRSLTSPILAHLVFNLVSAGGALIALHYSPLAGAAFAILAGLAGMSSLLYDYLTARKERSSRLAHGGKTLAALMIVGAGLALWQGGLKNDSGATYARAAAPSAVEQAQHGHHGTGDVSAFPAAAASEDAAPGESRAGMVARVKPSIVNVIVRVPGGAATGSGFILTPDGLFVTNGHVVGAKKPGELVNARVPGVDGELVAKVLAVNHDKDLAIVQLPPRPDGRPWPRLRLAITPPSEGEDVTALGYPLGQPFTVTGGVVSGVGDRGSLYVKHLQTDAAVNPGNSGGPLVNARGEVVGVNTQILSKSGGFEGVAISITASEVSRVMDQFSETGNIATASLGIIVDLSDPAAPTAGLAVEHVRRGSAAEKAGLKRGDLLIGVGGEIIMEGGGQAAGHVAAVLSKMAPGQSVTVVVMRGDEHVRLELTADAKNTAAPSH